MALLVVVFRLRVPVPVISITEELPAKVMADPLVVKLPPVVNSPVPVVTAPLPTVFKFTVPVPADTVRLAFPEVPITEALIDRALELNEAWDAGAIHTFLISYELVRQGQKGDPVARSQAHFDRAVQLSGGQLAAPFVVMAESVAVSRQDRKQFESLLKQALAIDVNAKPDWRLSNIVMQQRARWLLSRTDELIAQ